MGRRGGGEGPPPWIWVALLVFVLVVWLGAQVCVAIYMARMRGASRHKPTEVGRGLSKAADPRVEATSVCDRSVTFRKKQN
mmetsp:Transcript_17266/g.52198  ORF Transcript_17266/g.52198 Transcript_17266/m.52198 type:complete len:81 (+) Transcript_17266:62-304(+)